MNQQVFMHRVDIDGSITAVNDAWRRFALENGGEGLRSVEGSILWNYIGGAQTRHIYHVLMERARESGVTLRVPYRCDSPEARRFMCMEIVFLPAAGEFEFRNQVLRIEPRKPVALLSPSERYSDAVLRMCSWCKRVELDEGYWVEIEEAVRLLGLLDPIAVPRLSHGICPDCEQRFRRGELS